MSTDDPGPTIVVNDLLSFCAFKQKDVSKEKLLNCIRKFYPREEGLKAYEILISSLPESRMYLNPQKDKEPADPFLTIYEALQVIEENDFPMFVCKNLNNVPTLHKESKVKESRKSEIRKEHRVIKSQILEVFQTLYQLKEEMQVISENTPPNGGGNTLPSKKRKMDEESESPRESGTEFEESDYEVEEEEELALDQSLTTTIKQECPSSDEMEPLVQLEVGVEEEENTTAYYAIKHIFDENIGYFTILICSQCHFYSNDEEAMQEHRCHLTPIEYGMQLAGIWEELDFDKARQLEKEEKLKEKWLMKQTTTKKEAQEKKPKICDVYDKEQRCPLCGKKYSVPNWREHVRFCPGDGTTIPQNHYCNICDVFFADQSTLKLHQGFHDLTRPYECLQCKFRFLSQVDVDRHFNKHIPEKVTKTKCPFCPFPVLRNTSLTEHIKCHTGERPYECKICGAKFTNRRRLRKHLNVHNRREFTCNICQKVFRSENTMIVHRQYHSAERPYKCPICNKGFIDSKAMAKHQRKHAEEFSCPHCSFKAETSHSLREHVEKHNNCLLCDFKTTHKNIYLKHMMDHHPEALLSD